MKHALVVVPMCRLGNGLSYIVICTQHRIKMPSVLSERVVAR